MPSRHHSGSLEDPCRERGSQGCAAHLTCDIGEETDLVLIIVEPRKITQAALPADIVPMIAGAYRIASGERFGSAGRLAPNVARTSSMCRASCGELDAYEFGFPEQMYEKQGNHNLCNAAAGTMAKAIAAIPSGWSEKIKNDIFVQLRASSVRLEHGSPMSAVTPTAAGSGHHFISALCQEAT